MRAIVIHQFGDAAAMRAEEVPTPKPSAGEVLVEVRSAGVNPSDVKNIEGKMHGTTLPRIPGRDFAGVVKEGPAQWVGKEVWGTGGDIGFTRDGSHAQLIRVPAGALVKRPEKLSLEEAGSTPLTFVTAWAALVKAAQIKSGETVVIIGAGGGVGSAAAQIARWRGARVIAGVKSTDDIGNARAAGFAEVIETGGGKFAETIREMTNGRGAEIVFDTSGFMFAEAVESAAHFGRIPVITAPRDGEVKFNLRKLYRGELKVLGVDTRELDAVQSARLLEEIGPGFDSNALKVHLGQGYPLEKAGEAYAAVSAGKGRAFLRP